MEKLTMGVERVAGNLGKQLSRLPDGTVKITWVRIIDDYSDPACNSIPDLWPPQEWFDRILKKRK